MPKAIDPRKDPELEKWPDAIAWLRFVQAVGLAPNTFYAYRLGLICFLRYLDKRQLQPADVTRSLVGEYVEHLSTISRHQPASGSGIESSVGLANSTLQQRITVLRLFTEFLVSEGRLESLPVHRGQYTPGRAFSGRRPRALIRRYKSVPWIPDDQQWLRIAAHQKLLSPRNQLMLAMAYELGLRREELCSVDIPDIDFSARKVTIQASKTKSRRARVIPYSTDLSELFRIYLPLRDTHKPHSMRLFVSESPRNRATPVTGFTWTKIVESIRLATDLPKLSTHTFRHLRLTDLARSGWDLNEIAQFAGHSNLDTTRQYIHLSGIDLANRLASSMRAIHAWRAQSLTSSLQ